MTLFDPGLQPERTELAWRRTALSIALGSLIAMRLLPVALGAAAWALAGVAGLLFAAAVWAAARRRYRVATERLLADGDRAPMPDGMLLTVLAAAVALAAVAAVVVVLARA